MIVQRQAEAGELRERWRERRRKEWSEKIWNAQTCLQCARVGFGFHISVYCLDVFMAPSGGGYSVLQLLLCVLQFIAGDDDAGASKVAKRVGKSSRHGWLDRVYTHLTFTNATTITSSSSIIIITTTKITLHPGSHFPFRLFFHSVPIYFSLLSLENRLAFTWMPGSLVSREKTGAVVERHYFCLRFSQSLEHWHSSLFPLLLLLLLQRLLRGWSEWCVHCTRNLKPSGNVCVASNHTFRLKLVGIPPSPLTTREKIGLLFTEVTALDGPDSRFEALTFSSFTPNVRNIPHYPHIMWHGGYVLFPCLYRCTCPRAAIDKL